MYSTGTKQHLYVEIPELIKSIGDGILMSNGPNWTFQRNLLAPEFFQSKIMVSISFSFIIWDKKNYKLIK